MMDKPSVLVVGAGIGGLTLAAELRCRGVEVAVVERAQELAEVGAAIALAANGRRVLNKLGMDKGLAEVSTEMSALSFREGVSGRFLAGATGSYSDRFGAPYAGIHRGDLQRVLVGAAGEQALHLGKRVEAVEHDGPRPAVRFSDGTTMEADVIVGADGVHSKVRGFVAPDEPGPRYSGASAFRALISAGEVPDTVAPDTMQFWLGPGGHVLHYGIGPHDELINVLAVVHGPPTWPWHESTIQDEPGALAEAFTGWGAAVQDLLAAAPQSSRWALMHQPSLSTWSRGQVVLLGDAAHAMVPHHGQGANTAIEDAHVLAEALIDLPPHEAVQAYSCSRRGRTRAIARSSTDTLRLFMAPDVPAPEALDDVLERFSWIHGHAVV